MHEEDGEDNEDQAGDGRGDDFLALIELVGDTGRSSDDEDAVEDEKEGDAAAQADDDGQKAVDESPPRRVCGDATESSINIIRRADPLLSQGKRRSR